MFGDYVRKGWVITPIPPGRKSPVMDGWQHRAAGIDDPEVADELPGAGLLHAYSQTACLDIDDFELAAEWCELRGIDLQSLWEAPDAVKITSGRPNRGKLLYRLVLPLSSHQVSIKVEGLTKPKAVLDFRCGTRGQLTKQDVLPPSVHPDTGKPYEWAYNEPLLAHWSDPPPLPESVRVVWADLIAPRSTSPRTGHAPQGADADGIRAVLATKDPDCDRNAWVKVLSMLHHETRGADWGLALADEWSSKGTKYTGFADVETRWNSFSLEHANPATFAGIAWPLATAEDFPAVETPAPTPPDKIVAKALEEAEAAHEDEAKTRRGAEDLLVKSLVYVRKADAYYDIALNEFLESDHAIQHTWTSKMPRVQTPTGGVAALNPVEILKLSKRRKIVYAPAFNPGKGQFFEHEGKTYVNEYAGGLPDPIEPTTDELAKITELFNRIPDRIMRDWLLQFYGHAVQRPGVKMRAMPILWSHVMGNGKGTLLQTIPTLLFTERYSASITNSMLNEGYNGYLVGKWFGHFTEMHAASRGDKALVMNKIFPWISDDILPINIKFGASYPTVNFMFFTGASNHSDVVDISPFDRRFAIGSMDTVPIMTVEENQRYYAGFLNTPRAAGVLRHFFLNYPIATFNPNLAPPVTQAKLEMALQSRSHEVQVLVEAIENHDDCFASDVVSTPQILSFLKQAAPRSTMTLQKLGLVLTQSPLNFVNRKPNVSDGDSRKKVGLWICRHQKDWQDMTDKELVNYWQNAVDPLTL